MLATPVPMVVIAPCGRVDIAPVVQVTVGKSTVIKPPSPITRILLGNPENSRAATPKEPNEKTDRLSVAALASELRRPGVAELDIVLLSPSEVYVLGKSIGSTNVVLLDQSGRCTAFDVVVGMDTAALVHVPADGIAETVKAFNASILERRQESYVRLSRVLYAKVFEPVAALLRKPELLIIPDGDLQTINFETLLFEAADRGKLSALDSIA